VPYVREKKIPGKNGRVYTYYQLVEGRRVNGKVRQKVIAHLGKHDSIESARAAAANVVPKESQPAEPEVLVETAPLSEESAPPSVLDDDLDDEDAAPLRKKRTRLRAAARRRHLKVDDILVLAYRRGYTLTDEDWGKIAEINREAEELSHAADELSDELSRRREGSSTGLAFTTS
jgi:hypothetical protein